MKKLLILFTALALLAVAMPAIAEVTHGLVFYGYGITDFDDATADVASVLKARIKVGADLDEFNKIDTELRWDNGAGDNWDPANAKVKTFKLTTDVTGALGLDLPVTVKITGGVWETDFTDWWYSTRAGITFVGGFNEDEQGSGAAQLDVGIGPVTLHYYQNMGSGAQSTTFIGANGAFGPVAFWVAYKANLAAGFGEGAINTELKYAGTFGDLGLSVYPALDYNLATELFAWDAGLKATYKMLTVAASFQGKDPDWFDKIEAEVGASIGSASLWAAMYMSLAAADPFQGLDLMGSYKFGAATFYLGYVFCPDTTTVAVPVDGNEWGTTVGGLYLGMKASL